MGEAQRPTEIKSLTGLRGLAAALVFLFHMKSRGSEGDFLGPVYRVGWCGVTIFFTLSGFLLTLLYFELFRDRVTWPAFKSYFLKRVARIYPLYFFLLLVAVANAVWNRYPATHRPPLSWPDVLSHLVMLQGYFERFASSLTLIPAAWSLTIEESFYLLLPLLCLGLGLASRGPAGAVRPLPLVLAMVGLTGLLLVAGLGLARLLPPAAGFQLDWVNQSVFGQMPTFALGILAGVLVRRQPGLALFQSRLWANAVGVAGIALFVAGAWYFSPGGSWMEGFTGEAFFGGSAALMLLSLCGRSGFSWLLGQPALVYGGRISYAFYLIHTHPAFQDLIKVTGLNDPGPAYVVCSGLSAVCYQLVEKPAHGWLRRRWAGAA
jgi:peptidoglycan/LPS O-acetylase OafA/YrhL